MDLRPIPSHSRGRTGSIVWPKRPNDDLLPSRHLIRRCSARPIIPINSWRRWAIAAALKKLGLKMGSAKRPAELLVIDHVERSLKIEIVGTRGSKPIFLSDAFPK